MAKKQETYSEAQARLLSECVKVGIKVKPTLKIPQATLNYGTLFFRKQAVYLDNHSTWLDIRGMSLDDLLRNVHAISERRKEYPNDGT